MVEHDDVAGLLTAEPELAFQHRGEQIPVSDRRFHHVDARIPHRQPESQVGHDRSNDSVAGQPPFIVQREREHGEDLVAIDNPARGVDRQAPVRVSVVGDPAIGAVRPHRVGQGAQARRTAAGIDVVAVRLGADRDHVGARPGAAGAARRRRQRRARSRPPPAGRSAAPRRPTRRLASRWPEALDLARRQMSESTGQERSSVGCALGAPAPGAPAPGPLAPGLLAPGALARRPAPLRAGPPPAMAVVCRAAHVCLAAQRARARHGREAAFYLVLDSVGQLQAAASEKLDPVIGRRVVARGQHDPEVRAQRAGQVGERRCRQHAEPEHVHAGAGQAGHHRGLEELAGCPGIPANQRHRAAPPGRPRPGRRDRRRPTGPRRQQPRGRSRNAP